jgi:hypothetical protein
MTLRFALVLDGTYDGLPALSMRERAPGNIALRGSRRGWRP